MKKYLSLAAFLAVVVSFASPSFASKQGSPSGTAATVQGRRVAIDGSGQRFALNADLGFKVYESSGSLAAAAVVDEANTAPSCGLLHAVCISAGSNFAVVFDTSSTTLSGNGANASSSITGQLKAQSGALTCQVYDAQFNRGLVVINSDATGASYVYWRPCRGGSN